MKIICIDSYKKNQPYNSFVLNHTSKRLKRVTVFPQIIAGGNYSFFFTPKKGSYSREGDYSKEAIISNIAHRKSYPIYVCFIIPFNQKINK